MKVTATELAKDSKSVLDRVVQRRKEAEVQRHHKIVASIRRRGGADRKEMVELLKAIQFTKAETKELKAAMEAASEVFGYAGRD